MDNTDHGRDPEDRDVHRLSNKQSQTSFQSLSDEGENHSQHPTGASQTEDQDAKFTWWEMSVGVVGIVAYLFDLGTDFAVAVDFLRSGQIQFAGASFSIMCFSWLVGTIMTLFAWYREDEDNPALQEVKLRDLNVDEIIKTHSLGFRARFFSIVFLSAPLARTIEYLWVGKALMKPENLEEEESKVLKALLVFRQDSASGLRMLEGIFEAFLQLHVQLYAWFTEEDLIWDARSGTLRGLSAAFSWFSVSWSLTSWYIAKRKLEMKKDMSLRHKVLQFVYRVGEMGGRIIATTAFASRFGVAWTFIPLAVYFARGLAMSMAADEHEDRERKPLMAIFMFFFSYIHRDEDGDIAGGQFLLMISELVNFLIVIILINLWYHIPSQNGIEWRFPAHQAAYGLCWICCFVPVITGCFSCKKFLESDDDDGIPIA